MLATNVWWLTWSSSISRTSLSNPIITLDIQIPPEVLCFRYVFRVQSYKTSGGVTGCLGLGMSVKIPLQNICGVFFWISGSQSIFSRFFIGWWAPSPVINEVMGPLTVGWNNPSYTFIGPFILVETHLVKVEMFFFYLLWTSLWSLLFISWLTGQ